jgi:hypothetical protein
MDLSQFFQDFMNLIKKEAQKVHAKRRCMPEFAFLFCIYVGLHQMPRLPLFLLAGALRFKGFEGQIDPIFQGPGGLPNGTNIAFFEGQSSQARNLS